MKKILLFAAIIAIFVMRASIGSAALWVDSDRGLVYDTDQDITWLQDVNYVETTGYDDDLYGYDTGGALQWGHGMTWAENLVYEGHSDWRLPVTNEPCPGPGTDSEMAYLYYEGLGNSQWMQPWEVNWGPFINYYTDPLWYSYWTGTEVSTMGGSYPPDLYAWAFGFYGPGQQSPIEKGNDYYVWAVSDGNPFNIVPIPGAVWLLGSGIVALVGLRRRKA